MDSAGASASFLRESDAASTGLPDAGADRREVSVEYLSGESIQSQVRDIAKDLILRPPDTLASMPGGHVGAPEFETTNTRGTARIRELTF